MRNPIRIVIVLVVVFIVAAVLIVCPIWDDEGPESAVEGFLDALNERDWDGMMARMTAEAKATLPQDSKELIWKRAEVFALVERAGGHILFEITDHEMLGDDRARVSADLVANLPMGPLRRTATFHVKLDNGVWKLLPEIEDQSGMVIKDPLEFLTGKAMSKLESPR
jgi:hypothetical protein